MDPQEVLNKILEKLDKIQDDITDMKIIQARQEENISEHIHRTNLLEESSEVLYEEITKIKLHNSQVSGIFKAIGMISTLVTITMGVLKLFGKI